MREMFYSPDFSSFKSSKQATWSTERPSSFRSIEHQGVHVRITTSDEATIYVLGDIRGDIEPVVAWFKKKGLIKKVDGEIKWNAGPDVWVVQMGDQIDSGDMNT
jgi:hypothetical protein